MTFCNEIDTDLSNAQKFRYPDPEHKTKIIDFDVKWEILMLIEQIWKIDHKSREKLEYYI